MLIFAGILGLMVFVNRADVAAQRKGVNPGWRVFLRIFVGLGLAAIIALWIIYCGAW